MSRSFLDVMICSHNKFGGRHCLAAIVFLFIAGFLLHLPSEIGASFAIPPDSSEYAISLSNLFHHGIFGFTLNGEWYPSRYAPWFSLFCLSPAYFLFGGDVLALHWSVLAFALAFLLMSYKMAKLAGLGRWSIVCAVLPLFIPDFVFYSRMTMTEIPYTALFAASALVFVRFAEDESPSFRSCLGAGALITWCGTARVTALPMIAMFAVALLVKRVGWKKKLFSILALSAPAAAYEIVALSYNWRVFGSLFRSGYQYWVPCPCDFPDIAFGFDLAVRNVAMYVKEPIILISLACAFCVAVVAILMLAGFLGGCEDNRRFLLLSCYVFFQGVVLVTLYVGYFYCDQRFFLPVAFCLVPLFLAAVARIGEVVNVTWRALMLVVVVLVELGNFHIAQPKYAHLAEGYPFRVKEAQLADRVLPQGSVALIWGNPCILDFFGLGKKNIECIPLNRDFDYVRHMCAPSSIKKFEPRPKECSQLIIPELVSAGTCFLPFPETFEEKPETVTAYLESGRRVFLHRGIACNQNTGESKLLFASLDRMGLEARKYGVWTVPEIKANPVRHIYDRFVFPFFSMDSHPEVKAVYYEIVSKE